MLLPIAQMSRPRWERVGPSGQAAALRASRALSGFPVGCRVPAWKFTAAAGCPWSLRCPDVGAGIRRLSPGLFPLAIYACLRINTIDKSM